jgi:hypothetical protein
VRTGGQRAVVPPETRNQQGGALGDNGKETLGRWFLETKLVPLGSGKKRGSNGAKIIGIGGG